MTYNETCSVCIEDFKEDDQIAPLTCGHQFHVSCIIKCLRKSNECPNCRDTDGNPVSKVQSDNSYLFNWDSDSVESIDDDYADFLDCMKNLLKTDSDLAINIREYKKNCKLFERKCKTIDRLYDKSWDKCFNEFRGNFKNSDEYKDYLDTKSNFGKTKGAIKRQVKNYLEKKMNIPRDANGEFVEKYIEEMFDGFLFELI